MFFKNNLFNSFLAVFKHAAQLRSDKNKVIFSNKSGSALFQTGENPFFFLKNAENPAQVQALIEAYCAGKNFSETFMVNEKAYKITLYPLKGFILIIAKDVSSTLAIHQQLQKQLLFFSKIFETFHNPLYVVDKKGKLIFVNQIFSQLFNLKNDQLSDFVLADFLTGNTPLPEQNWEGLCRDNNAVPRSFFVHQQQIRISDVFYVGHLTPYTAAQSSFENSFFQQIPFPALLIDVFSKKIKRVNPSAVGLFEKNHPEITGTDFLSLLTEASYKTCSECFGKMLSGETEREQTDITFSVLYGGKTFNSFLGWSGPEKDVFILYLIDATERKNLENQVVHAQKMQAMGQMAGGVAHDFNNLLTAIIGFTDLLLEKNNPQSPNFPDLMQIKGNANKATALVAQLLTFSRKQPVQKKLISVYDAFVDLSALLRRAVAPFVTLQIEVKRNSDCINMAPAQFTQILLNLAINAKDAMQSGGILKIITQKEKTKKAKPCGLDIMPAGEYIKIIVSDTGIGIAPENLPRIFEPFFTTKEANTKSGTGLGLSTVYGIVRACDGYISVDSEKNIGTIFCIYLPFAGKKQKEEISVASALPVLSTPSQKHILLVDDEEGVRLVTARYLKNNGFLITECSSGEQALELLKQRPFDLVLTDMVMQQVTGEDVCQKSKELYPYVPVILMSGYSENFIQHATQNDAPFHFLAKPFELPDLLKAVHSVINSKSE